MLIENWKLVDNEYSIETKIPFSLQTDLEKNGYIEDILKNSNEQVVQQFDKKPWKYESTFNIDEVKDIKIIFKKIDVLANIYVNGIYIYTCNNFFVPHEVKIDQSILKSGQNKIEVLFESTTKKGQEIIAKQGYNLPATNDTSQMGQMHDDKASVYFRKPPYHYGWDWGPRIVSVGIYEEVMVVDSEYKELNFNITYNLDGNKAIVELTPDFHAADFIVLFEDKEMNFEYSDGKIVFDVQDYELWWPNGFGEQKLYNIELKTCNISKIKRIGFRTIKVVQENDEFGRCFDFYVNGKRMFMKGSNRIPSEVLHDKLNYDKVKWELETAKLSNNNMIRVWGGGIYEPDYFYELCDEYGLIVWQDFMFACSMYPGDQEFLDNIKHEVEYIINSLKDYTCIGLFCGNNEMSVAWCESDPNQGWGWKQKYTPDQRKVIYKSYDTIFNELIPSIVESECDIFYWNSSPWNNSEMIPTTPKNLVGDSHYWGVWHRKDKVEEYDNNISRFVSEYGMQSFSSFELLEKYVSKDKLFLLSDEIMLRQKSGDFGNSLIKNYVEEMIGNAEVEFEQFCYLSQVNQADAMHKALTLHRLNKHKCSGSLYWQLNDVWPGATWSSMEYDGKWKACQYYIRQACDMVTPIVKVDDGIANIFVLNDSYEDQNSECFIQFIEPDGNVIIAETFDQTLESSKNKFISQYYLKDKLENCYIKVTLNGVETILLPNKPKYMKFVKPNISWKLEELDGKYSIVLLSDTFSPYTEIVLDKRELFVNNNFLHLEAGIEQRIPVSSECGITKIRTLLGN